MSTYDKMRRVNSIIRKELTKLGFYDIRMFGHSRWFKDVYGWDGVAKYPVVKKLHKALGMKYIVVWIQCKTGFILQEDKQELDKFCSESGESGLFAEYVPFKVKYKNKKGSYVKHKVKLTPVGFRL